MYSITQCHSKKNTVLARLHQLNSECTSSRAQVHLTRRKMITFDSCFTLLSSVNDEIMIENERKQQETSIRISVNIIVHFQLLFLLINFWFSTSKRNITSWWSSMFLLGFYSDMLSKSLHICLQLSRCSLRDNANRAKKTVFVLVSIDSEESFNFNINWLCWIQ